MMRSKGWDAVVLTGNDPHNSEYSAPRWLQAGWVSGFSGEGDLVVTDDHAGIWTDTRYFIQASRQLPGTGVELHKTRVPGQVLIPEWLAAHFADYDSVIVAVDGLGMNAATVLDIKKAMGDKAIIVDAPNMLDPVWEGRPPVPQTPVITLGAETVGWSRTQKLTWIRKWLQDNGSDAILVTALDEIAWMLNVRGQDVEYNPVVMSYLLVTRDDAFWFVDIPLLGRYHTGVGKRNWTFGVGPALSFCVRNETFYVDADPHSPLNHLDKCKAFTLGLQPTASYQFARHFNVGLDCFICLTDQKLHHGMASGSKYIHSFTVRMARFGPPKKLAALMR